MKDNITENKECQWVTKAIRNMDNELILKFIVFNKIGDKLRINRFKILNYA